MELPVREEASSVGRMILSLAHNTTYQVQYPTEEEVLGGGRLMDLIVEIVLASHAAELLVWIRHLLSRS